VRKDVTLKVLEHLRIAKEASDVDQHISEQRFRFSAIALDELRVLGRRGEAAKQHAAGSATPDRRVAVLTEVDAGHLLQCGEHARELIAAFSGRRYSFIST
jgi:hypothetical protein